MRCSITGTTTSAVQPCCAVSDSVASSSNLRLSTIVEDSPMPSVKCAKPQAWNSGAAIIVFSRAFSGMRDEQRRDRVERLRLAARGALRRAGGAGGEDDRLARLLGRDDVGGVAALDQLLERRVLGLGLRLGPRDVALAPVPGVGQHLGELLVVDDRLRLLAVGDVGQLRAGERRVEEQRVRPELRAGDDRLDEAAVVAGHDRHVVALVDAVVGERVGERVRALLDLPERELAELVDQRDLVGVAGGRRLVAGGGRDAPADDADGGAERAIRAAGAG